MQFSMSRPESDVFAVCYVLTKLDDEKRWKLLDSSEPVRSSSDSSRSRLLQHHKRQSVYDLRQWKLRRETEKKKKKNSRGDEWIGKKFSNSKFQFSSWIKKKRYFFPMVCRFFLFLFFFKKLEASVKLVHKSGSLRESLVELVWNTNKKSEL